MWPDSWAVDEDARRGCVDAIVPGAASIISDALGVLSVRSDADQAVHEILTARGFDVDGLTAALVRKAMCAPLDPYAAPVPGAEDLLRAIRRLGKRCVIVSNVTVRDAELYGHDFRGLGWDRYIDACVTSIEAGCRKPAAGIFDAALAAAACSRQACVMIGDSEENDIVPAKRVGMRAIKIGNPTAPTSADANVSGPADCISLLDAWSA